MKAHRPTIMGTRYMVAACQYLAAEAGFRILETGGNAIDAGVATGIALGVVQPEYVNFAGVAPIIIYSAADDRVFTIPGLGSWPKAIARDHFKKHHAGKIPQGILRTVVPAAPDAWITALERFGTMSFREVAESAIGFARDGFPVYPLMSEIVTEHEAEYRRFPSNVAIYLPQDRPPQPGEIAGGGSALQRRAMPSIGATSPAPLSSFRRITAAYCLPTISQVIGRASRSRSRPRLAISGCSPVALGARGRRCWRRSTFWMQPSYASLATTPPVTCTASLRP